MEASRTSGAWRVAVAVIGISILVTLGVLPFADLPGPVIPGIIPFFAAGVFVTASATGFLLFVQFREGRSWSLLLLACAYLYLGLMSLPQLMTAPGAILPDRPLIGPPQSSAWIYVTWVIGYTSLALAAIVAEARTRGRSIAPARVANAVAAAIAAVSMAVIGFALVGTLAVDRLPALLSGSSWTGLNLTFSVSGIVLAACGVVVILAAIDRGNELFHWLALALTTFSCANIVSSVGGGRYTVGWTVARLSWVISAGVLFLYFMALFTRQQRALADARDALERRVQDRTAALQESEARLRRAIESAPFPLMLHAADGEVLAVSEAWSRLSGYSREELRTRFDWTRRAYPDSFAEVDAFIDRQFHIAKATASGEREFRAKDGGRRVWDFTNIPMGVTPDGRPLTLSAALDVTRRRQDEARQKLLAREVDHRSKNMLAVLQVMLRHTRANTLTDYAEAVQGRVAALARTHTLLAQARWEGADLKTLIDEEMAPYRKGERVRAEGPAVALAPEAAQSIAMAVHELATNAAKYGALSMPQGHVGVEWRLRMGVGLEIVWDESGGPVVTPPVQHGLGTSVIHRSIEEQLAGSVRFDWRPQGLRCEITVPPEQIGHHTARDEGNGVAAANRTA